MRARGPPQTSDRTPITHAGVPQSLAVDSLRGLQGSVRMG